MGRGFRGKSSNPLRLMTVENKATSFTIWVGDSKIKALTL
jgi:hypothetical protein